MGIPRTIAKSGSSSVEAGAALGSQGHGHPGWKPSFQAQSVQPGVDQGGEDLPQPGTAQRVDVLIPTAVLHVMQVVALPLRTAVSRLHTLIVVVVIVNSLMKQTRDYYYYVGCTRLGIASGQRE